MATLSSAFRLSRKALIRSTTTIPSQSFLLLPRSLSSTTTTTTTTNADTTATSTPGLRKYRAGIKVSVDAYVGCHLFMMGDVTVNERSSIWDQTHLVAAPRPNKIIIDVCSNVLQRCHINFHQPSKYDISCSTGLPAETSIGKFVSIGENCRLWSCTIESECIIGMESTLNEGSWVETQSILEAGSVVPRGQRIPTGQLWAGNPARFVRSLTHEEILEIPKLAVAISDLSKTIKVVRKPYSSNYYKVYPEVAMLVEKFKKSLKINISLNQYMPASYDEVISYLKQFERK